jgi:hypothetical protein
MSAHSLALEITMLEIWQWWVAAFDQSVEDDQWDRLSPFLTDDVIYSVSGVPYACELRGRDAVIAGFAKSIRGFDRHFDERHWYGVGIKLCEPNLITGRAMGRYVMKDKPELYFSASSLWLFRGQQLSMMSDIYDTSEVDVMRAFQWLEQYGDGLDPSYA